MRSPRAASCRSSRSRSITPRPPPRRVEAADRAASTLRGGGRHGHRHSQPPDIDVLSRPAPARSVPGPSRGAGDLRSARPARLRRAGRSVRVDPHLRPSPRVDETGLLVELGRAVAAPAPEPLVPAPDLPGIEATIYRRYFLGAIALALTAGATWGAWILWTIGLSGSFQGVSPHRVKAHGEAQVFGWAGLFIMGFAYQAFPSFWGTTLAAPRLAA